MTHSVIPEGFDFTDPDLYAKRLPMREFAHLRETAPVWWNDQKGAPYYGDKGFWVVSRHEDVRTVSKNGELFSSERKSAIMRFNEEMNADGMQALKLMMLNMDSPQHAKIRKIVAKGFTPKAVAGLTEVLRTRAGEIVRAAKEKSAGDFVTEVACELPLQAIADLLGVPQKDRMKLFEWSNQMIGYDDPEYEVDPMTSSAELAGYAWQMAEERRQCPMGDIVSSLIHADVDGEKLSSEEFSFFVILLSVAGNETTRNAITHGMKAFLDHPEQWEYYKEHRPVTAADEIVRWATPVVCFQRTATQDTELGGQTIAAGDRIGMFYSSANFDPEVFTEPTRFDITRDPNPHLGFGAKGAHYCLGVNLAKLELDLIFGAIADAMPNISQAEEPRRLRSGWLNGIKEFKVNYG